jgi:hypothetical protein
MHIIIYLFLYMHLKIFFLFFPHKIAIHCKILKLYKSIKLKKKKNNYFYEKKDFQIFKEKFRFGSESQIKNKKAKYH